MRVAFVGLGVMGYPMAGFLADAGHEITVYNRTKEKAEAWQKFYGGTIADTPAGAAVCADIIFCCVGDDPDVRAVILGDDGILEGLSEGSVVVDHTTASAKVSAGSREKSADRSSSSTLTWTLVFNAANFSMAFLYLRSV